MQEHERNQLDDLRDRLTRTEQNHLNLKENFQAFKEETNEEFNSLNRKLDQLIDDISSIKMTLAKWLGAGGVLLLIGQQLAEYLLKSL